MFRCYSLLQISVKHIQHIPLSKGQTVSRTYIEMGHALYIVRYYTAITHLFWWRQKIVGAMQLPPEQCSKFKTLVDWWLCGLILSNLCGLSQSVMGNHKPASGIQYTGITLQVTLLTMNGSGEVSQSFRIDLWRNMVELVLVETSKARTTNSDDLFMILRG